MSVVDMVFDAIFATSGRKSKPAKVPTATLPADPTMVETLNLRMIDPVQGEQGLIALLQDPEACRRELARSPGFQDWLQMVFNAALRTHDIKVLHQIHICVGVFEKLICWYKEALPLLASALAMNETYPYTPEVRRERAEMAFKIVFNIMRYTSDYGDQGVTMRNAIHQAFVEATVPQNVMDDFQHFGFVQANKREGCNGPNDDLTAERELHAALEEAWDNAPEPNPPRYQHYDPYGDTRAPNANQGPTLQRTHTDERGYGEQRQFFSSLG